ncbi:MAG TPA: hypothetical protein VFX12_13715 [Vicinamibacterales bacterium]|nr:hypothetical protein [Vicinamibacterales bacterium]
MTARIALGINAVVGIVTTLLASATIWLAVTRPAAVATALADRAYGEMLTAVGQQLAGWVQVLWRFL